MEFRLVELSTGKDVRKISKDIEGGRAIRFSPDGRFALVGDNTSKPNMVVASETTGAMCIFTTTA